MFKEKGKMEKQLTPKQKARQKYELLHKEEREQATRQFNTRIPAKEHDEIMAFLKQKRISKVDLIRLGYQTLRKEFEESK